MARGTSATPYQHRGWVKREQEGAVASSSPFPISSSSRVPRWGQSQALRPFGDSRATPGPGHQAPSSVGFWHGEDPRCSPPGSPGHAAVPGGHLWPCHSRSLPRPRSHSLVLGQAQPQGFPSHHAEGTVTTGGGQPGWSRLPTLPARAGLRGMRESPAGEPAPRRHRAPSRVSHGPVTAGTAPAVRGGGRGPNPSPPRCRPGAWPRPPNHRRGTARARNSRREATKG